ncbi:MAG: HAD-IIIA family hydrolase [Sphingobacteriales bacterium]|nr:MAG: HAD-IIIA family hydrolase [Sphingobacteriales bacterium]
MSTFNIQAQIDKNWTLFLDRDGVINVECIGSYITEWSEFQFCDGALDALRSLSELFGTVVVVSNQRGVGRGIMSIDDLKVISVNMTREVEAAGGRIDRVYAATAVNTEDHNRKPNTGMAMQAKEDFPMIDFKRSVMVGNAVSDMEFGKRLAMHTVFLTTKHEPFELPHDLIDEQYPSLQAWAHTLKAAEVVG